MAQTIRIALASQRNVSEGSEESEGRWQRTRERGRVAGEEIGRYCEVLAAMAAIGAVAVAATVAGIRKRCCEGKVPKCCKKARRDRNEFSRERKWRAVKKDHHGPF
jgi:hypothetical protein